tara:strand:- start:165 stop:542 length:378 start_codon:yes stop_codon:yes gene_type:complete
MIVREIKKLLGTERDVQGDGFKSIRILLAKDNMGFSLHKTIIPKGGPYHWHYKNHLEACYCIEGFGILTDLDSGEQHIIKPDTIYVLDHYDNHLFESLKDVILISIFNPAIKGTEIHQKDGSYIL